MLLSQRERIRQIIRAALEEDIGSGDVTTDAALTGEETGRARALVKQDTVIAGGEVFREVFLTHDPALEVVLFRRDGETAQAGEVVAEVSGRLKSILTAERVALNLFQRMCGIAAQTRRYAEETKGTKAKILDTRKTMPGLRILDKYAVTVGGGCNHRIGLYDGILIKDNHISAAGGITAAVRRVTGHAPLLVRVEVEVKNLEEVREALSAGAHVIMLDNMGREDMKKAVDLIAGRALVEASGNVTLERVREIAQTGVDFISTGAVTHSVAAADISLKVQSWHRRPGGAAEE
ncbi:MAG TPA: carboxylating nicotinate-nucleotide diphosphorylase [Syntrophales bacterium]|jgi:nicotinate-nucleotide pyrophosphorylase (carboxylating)|nr:carboxylating nicotinate-nucleotide diphosphorylase [Syntrophales bacterium]